ncbi:G-protein coupled receptors family 1 profile domain-containing protein [Caenorhabditis elegans]|uniref:G-protein coupled receptors family 1 profile domain-containing protein n=1 Tax=Caenorhabditis elegans TaxID=6239 RepID=Q9N452_CAEEL|nr:G-protein coupled receptors family 1 profile domain-containing protein [Caenorhabditis elegans]CCD68050.1 G-protein coupled receptors family 1 profile domain-containing protein [Caenorhabditis elegans]|eukprot:NP_490815.2 NeuroPeptide Receptor family [Caenorhabditis elegans]
MYGFFNSSEIDEEYYNSTHTSAPSPILALIFTIICIIGVIGNASLLVYIFAKKLYQNFISSRFIGHLCFTNLIALLVLVPVIIHNVFTGVNLLQDSNMLCRIQVSITVTVWTVIAMMNLCIAGVHLLTFARIHYEQLFGLTPTKLCILSWIISWLLSLPSLTNGHVAIYGPAVRTCVFSHSDSGLKFLTYTMIFGVFIPALFSSIAYFRILQTLFHSPIVFQSLGLYKSRFLVYFFLLGPLYALPFYILTALDPSDPVRMSQDTLWTIGCTMFAFVPCIIAPLLYGASIFIIKEEDMALTARTHTKTGTGAYHHVAHQHNMQAQLI